MRRHSQLAMLCTTWALLLAGCSMVISADEDELGRPPQACEPGTVKQCPPEACPPGSAPGVQECTREGQYTFPCRCPVTAGSGG